VIDVPLAEGKSSLNRLLLSGCSLTNKALQILASKIPGKLNRLTYLDVSNNDQLTTESLSFIAAMISSPGTIFLLTQLNRSRKRKSTPLDPAFGTAFET